MNVVKTVRLSAEVVVRYALTVALFALNVKNVQIVLVTTSSARAVVIVVSAL